MTPTRERGREMRRKVMPTGKSPTVAVSQFAFLIHLMSDSSFKLQVHHISSLTG